MTTKTVTRHVYTVSFEQFWKAYPRSDGKYNAFKAWLKNGIDDDAFLPTQILQDVDKRTRLKYWPFDKKKVPHGATWINARRWEDEGWENEIKTYGKEKDTSLIRQSTTFVNDAPKLSSVAAAANRFLFKYVLTAGGMLDERMQQAVRIKNSLVKEFTPMIAEEIEIDPSKYGEMQLLLAETLFLRLDLGLSLEQRGRMIA